MAPGPGSSPRIDTHSHWVSPSYVEFVEAQSEADPAFARANAALRAFAGNADAPVRRLDLRLEEMDRWGIDVSVLSLPPPAATFGDADLISRVARAANDEFLAAADEHPGRFVVLISLPLLETDHALAELERVASHGAARGIELLTTTERWSIDDARLEPVYARAAELGMPIRTHPATEALGEAWADWFLGASLAPMVSSSLGVARLVLCGMLDRVASLDVIVSHLGGTLPYLAQRFADFGSGEAEHDLLYYLRNRLYLDTCSFHTPAFRCAMDTAGVDRLVLGSDYPFRGSLQRLIDDVEAAVSDEHERELVFGRTAAKWFGEPAKKKPANHKARR